MQQIIHNLCYVANADWWVIANYLLAAYLFPFFCDPYSF